MTQGLSDATLAGGMTPAGRPEQLHYVLIGAASTAYALAAEYELLTGERPDREPELGVVLEGQRGLANEVSIHMSADLSRRAGDPDSQNLAAVHSARQWGVLPRATRWQRQTASVLPPKRPVLTGTALALRPSRKEPRGRSA